MVYATNIGDQLTSLTSGLVDVALKVLIFLIIMGLGWFVARWIRKWIGRALVRVGFDRAVERGGLNRLLGNYSASDLTARLVALAFMLFVLQLAFGIFGPNPVSDLIHAVIAWLPKLFVAVVIVVVAAAIAGWVRDLIGRGLGGVAYGRAIAVTCQALIIGLGVIAALNQVGVATTVTLPVLIMVLATIAGILIVGVGGGLIKPMQHRWERILNRAETETTLAAEKVRANRAARGSRDTNVPGGFEQPAYGGTRPGGQARPDATTQQIFPETTER
jgi:hypothetical protein